MHTVDRETLEEFAKHFGYDVEYLATINPVGLPSGRNRNHTAKQSESLRFQQANARYNLAQAENNRLREQVAELRKSIDETNKHLGVVAIREAQEARAMAKSNQPVALGRRSSQRGDFRALVRQKQEDGLTPTAAVLWVDRHYPGLRQQYVEQSNQRRRTR